MIKYPDGDGELLINQHKTSQYITIISTKTIRVITMDDYRKFIKTCS